MEKYNKILLIILGIVTVCLITMTILNEIFLDEFMKSSFEKQIVL
jgi:hypothetical protein